MKKLMQFVFPATLLVFYWTCANLLFNTVALSNDASSKNECSALSTEQEKREFLQQLHAGTNHEQLERSLAKLGLSEKQKSALMQAGPNDVDMLYRSMRLEIGSLILDAVIHNELITMHYLAYVKNIPLAKYGPDLYEGGCLNNAVTRGHYAMTEFLLRHGFKSSAHRGKMGAIFLAIYPGFNPEGAGQVRSDSPPNLKLLKLLLDYGSNPVEETFGVDALTWEPAALKFAIEYQYPARDAVITALRQRGYDF